nr:TPA_asm: hypothetical protein HUJ06_020880 [Nelumbo nucifera]
MRRSISLFNLAISVLILSQVAVGEDVVEETCKKVAAKEPGMSYDFCVASLQADPKSRTADLPGLGVISMKLMISNATNVNEYIKQLLKDGKLENMTRQALEDCSSLYSDSISSVKDAINDFKSKDYNGANIKISAAMEAPTTCGEGLSEGKAKESGLTERNDAFYKLSGIALVITTLFN